MSRIVTRTLLFSTLFPNSVCPGHGIFVETRLRELLATHEVDTRVIAPVPWFPIRHRVFGEYAKMAAVPKHEDREGVQVAHPRYLVLPKVGMNIAPFSLARAGLRAARATIASGFAFDLIDAHYFYPDGVAATKIGKSLNKPVVITARGSDINLISQFAVPRRLILEAARASAAVIAVSAALKERLVALGVASEKIAVLRNGVNLELFHPEGRVSARSRLGVSTYMILSVGNLIPAKGHHLVIEALVHLPEARVYIVGRGAGEQELVALARRVGVADRVTFVGAIPQTQLQSLYAAADCLVLASEREGWPNVLLEAMACGTPVIASRVGGVPEVVTTTDAGRLLDDRSVPAIVNAVEQLRATQGMRSATRAHAERFGWGETSRGQVAIFRDILKRSRNA